MFNESRISDFKSFIMDINRERESLDKKIEQEIVETLRDLSAPLLEFVNQVGDIFVKYEDEYSIEYDICLLYYDRNEFFRISQWFESNDSKICIGNKGELCFNIGTQEVKEFNKNSYSRNKFIGSLESFEANPDYKFNLVIWVKSEEYEKEDVISEISEEFKSRYPGVNFRSRLLLAGDAVGGDFRTNEMGQYAVEMYKIDMKFSIKDI